MTTHAQVKPRGAFWRARFSSPVVSISDVDCRPHHVGCTHEFCFAQDRIAFVRRGAFRKHIGGEPIVADPATLIYFPAEQGFRTSHMDLGGDLCTFVSLERETLHEVAHSAGRKTDGGDPFGATHAGITARTLLASRRLFARIENGLVSTVEAEEGTLDLVRAAAAGGEPQTAPVVSQGARRLAAAARELVASDPAAPGGLSDMARTLGVSVFHLARVFTAVTGSSLHSYQMRLRLTAALEALLRGAPDVSAVAFENGFSSHSHLTYAFRKAFGVTPSQARLLKFRPVAGGAW